MQLRFSPPLSGLEPLSDYDLRPVPGADGLYSLRSLERPSLRLFVLDPALYLPDYLPELPSAADSAGATGDAEADDVEDVPELLVIVTPRSGGPTVNLLAPLVIDARRGQARQVVLADDVARVRTPLRTLPASD